MTNQKVIRQVLDHAGSQFVSVTFIKKDGTQRQLTMNPKHVGDIKGTGTPCQDSNIFRIMDINLNQWRSFDARRVISIKVGGQVIPLEVEA